MARIHTRCFLFIALVFAILLALPPGVQAAGGSGSGVTKKQRIDPALLNEIVEKSLAVSEAGDGEGGNLDLPVRGRVSSTVGLRQDPINGRVRMHKGVDIAIPSGTPVTPVAAGRVAYSGMQPGYGNMVIVQHDDGMVTIYAHHSRNVVKAGERVDKGTKLALSGSTGHSTGPHLHFEAWQAGKNVTEAFMPAFSGLRVEESRHASLEKTNLRKVILSDGTLLFVEVAHKGEQKQH